MSDEQKDVEMGADSTVEQQSGNVIDLPIAGNEELTIDLDTELTHPDEMSDLFESEAAAPKYWLAVACAYARKGEVHHALAFLKLLLESENIPRTDEDVTAIYSCLTWLYLRQSREAPVQAPENNKDHCKEYYHKKATEYTNLMLQHGKKNTSTLNAIARGALSLTNSQFDHALTHFSQALKDNDDNLFGKLGKARVLYEKKNYKEALKQYQHVLQARPDIKPDPRIGIGLCFWQLGDEAAAVSAWERAEELGPSEAALVLLGMAHMEKALQNAGATDFAEKYSNAINYAQRAFKINPNSSPASTMLASYLFSKRNNDVVKQLGERGATATNVPLLQAEGWFWKGRAHHYLKEYDEALQCYDMAAELSKNDVLPQIGRGLVQYAKDDTADALLTFEQLGSKNPTCAEAFLMTGLLRTQMAENDVKQKLNDGRINREKAVMALEKYLGRVNSRDELPPIEVLLTLARLNENKVDKTLSVFEEIVTSHDLGDLAAQVYNNVGALYYSKNSFEAAKTNLENAQERLSENPNEQLKVTLEYNTARLNEAMGDMAKAREGYDSVLAQYPEYLDARIRLAYIDIENEGKECESVKQLLKAEDGNMEVRSLYSYYLSNHNRGEAEKNHNSVSKSYAKHDSYNLCAMGNFYLALGRQKKSEGAYHQAATCFHKALTIDKNNAYAAQGVAIVFAETKHPEQALSIFSRVRDTINDVSVYINMGHCYCDLRQYQLAIESYEIALNRFSQGKDPQLMVLLGKAWYTRGLVEKNVEALKTSVEYCQKAMGVFNDDNNPNFKFNIAHVQFYIGDVVRHFDRSKRTSEMVEDAIKHTKNSIQVFEELSERKNVPFQNLDQRIKIAKNTVLAKLEAALAEQQTYEQENQERIAEAKRKQEEQRKRLEAERKKREEQEAERQRALAEERKRLQEQAREWAASAEENAKRQAEREEMEKQEKQERKEKRKSGIKEPRERKPKKQSTSRSAAAAAAKSGRNKRGRKKRAADDEDVEEDDSGKKNYQLSKDYISDSDDVVSEEEAKDTDDEGNKRGGSDNEDEETVSPKKKRRIVDDEDDEDEDEDGKDNDVSMSKDD